MENQSQQFSTLIEQIYAASEDDDWPTFLQNLVTALNADKATLSRVDPQSSCLSMMASSGLSTKDEARYAERYAYLDPWKDILVDFPMGSAHLTHQLFTKHFLHATVIYREFWDPLGMHFGVGGRFGSGYVAVYRNKSQGPFDAPTRDLLGTLMPHLDRAFQMEKSRVELDGQWLASRMALNLIGVGVIFIDNSGSPIFLNDKATELVTKCHGITVRSNGVYATRHGEKEAFKTLIDNVLSATRGEIKHDGGTIRLTCPKSTQPISALVMPLQNISAFSLKGFSRPCATIILCLSGWLPRPQDVVVRSYLA